MPSETSHTGTSLVPTRLPAPRAHYAGTDATFLSQLIAARDNLPAQRLRRRAPVSAALDTYLAGAHRADRRLPAGYRKALSV